MAEKKYKLNTWVAVWNPFPSLFIAKNLSHPAWSRLPKKHRSDFLRGIFLFQPSGSKGKGTVLFCSSGGESAERLQSCTFPTAVSLQSCLHSIYKDLSVTSAEVRPISSGWGKDKSLPLEAAGKKSCSFCTGREPERNSRGQGQEGEDQGHEGIFGISFSGQPRISPSSFCADLWQSWLALLKKPPSLDLVYQSNQTTPGTWLALDGGKNLMVVPKCKSLLQLEWTVISPAMLLSFSYHL